MWSVTRDLVGFTKSSTGSILLTKAIIIKQEIGSIFYFKGSGAHRYWRLSGFMGPGEHWGLLHHLLSKWLFQHTRKAQVTAKRKAIESRKQDWKPFLLSLWLTSFSSSVFCNLSTCRTSSLNLTVDRQSKAKGEHVCQPRKQLRREDAHNRTP